MHEDIQTLDDPFVPLLEEARSQVQTGLRPSIQVAVHWRGRLCVDFAVGLEPTSTRAHYLLWSSVKPLVAWSLLQEMQRDRACLDDRVTRFIPEFGKHGKEAVTLLHLLTHRGGFPDSAPELARELSLRQSDFDEALRFVYDMHTLWEPGTERGYHPRSAWYVIAEVVQRINDRPLIDILRERVIGPAGMEQSAFALGDPERLGSRAMRIETLTARGSPSRAEAELWNHAATHPVVIPGGGGISRANQMVYFYRALLDTLRDGKERLTNLEWTRAATFPHIVGSRDRTFLLDIPWGLGVHLKHVRPALDDCGQSATPGTFGHAGHFMVNTAWADPKKDLVFCTLANGLAPSREGRAAVERLSEAAHKGVEAASH